MIIISQKFSRFAVNCSLYRFNHLLHSYLSLLLQRTWAVLYVNVQTSAVVDLGCLSDSVPLLRTRCVVFVRLMYAVIVQAIYIHYIHAQIGNIQHNRKLLSDLSLTTTLLLEITALLRHFTTVYLVHHFTQPQYR